MEFTITKLILDMRGFKPVYEACKAIQRKIRVGILNNSEEAEIGALQHYGGTGEYTYGKYKGQKVDIPPRPFISAPVEHFGETALKAGAESFDFTGNSADKVLNAVGSAMATQIKALMNMNGVYPPPNSERTVETKGFDHPLIDTGKLRDSITYEVDEK